MNLIDRLPKNFDDPFEEDEDMKEGIRQMAKEICDQIDKEVLEELFEMIDKQNDDAFERGKGVL